MDKRNFIQAIFVFLQNPFLPNFFSKSIYSGKLKKFCAPGLNCYSCPAAAFSCPIGAIQANFSGRQKSISFFLIASILAFSSVFARVICGFFCPFGFLQDILDKVACKKIRKFEFEKYLIKIKYLVLISFVIVFPLLINNAFGISSPYFCQFICPQGTLQAGIYFVTFEESLRQVIGFLFYWKLSLLIFILILSTKIYRPFCKYICPLGAIYSFFNSISFYQVNLDKDACISCGKCADICKMNASVFENKNMSECIRCGDCAKTCPENAILISFDIKVNKRAS